MFAFFQTMVNYHSTANVNRTEVDGDPCAVDLTELVPGVGSSMPIRLLPVSLDDHFDDKRTRIGSVQEHRSVSVGCLRIARSSLMVRGRFKQSIVCVTNFRHCISTMAYPSECSKNTPLVQTPVFHHSLPLFRFDLQAYLRQSGSSRS